jgi:hypothetical protein
MKVCPPQNFPLAKKCRGNRSGTQVFRRQKSARPSLSAAKAKILSQASATIAHSPLEGSEQFEAQKSAKNKIECRLKNLDLSATKTKLNSKLEEQNKM